MHFRIDFTTVLARLKFALPSTLSEQQKIVELIEEQTAPIQIAKSKYEKEIQLLQEYRTRLISDVVTGKLDVREVAKNLPIETIAEPIEDIGEGEDEELEDAA